MAFDSTPTTPAELTAAVEAVSVAQQPEPWANQFSWPPTYNDAPLPQSAVYDSAFGTVVLGFNMAIVEDTFDTGDWEVIVESNTPGTFHRKVVSDAVAAGDNTVELTVTGTDVVSGPAAVVYTAADDFIIAQKNGLTAPPFVQPITVPD